MDVGNADITSATSLSKDEAPNFPNKCTGNKEGTARSSPAPTIRETVAKLLSEGVQRETDPETFKAALDAVRFEHQRLQNEFMTLMSLNEHVQQKLDNLFDNNVKMELGLGVKQQ